MVYFVCEEAVLSNCWHICANCLLVDYEVQAMGSDQLPQHYYVFFAPAQVDSYLYCSDSKTRHTNCQCFLGCFYSCLCRFCSSLANRTHSTCKSFNYLFHFQRFTHFF